MINNRGKKTKGKNERKPVFIRVNSCLYRRLFEKTKPKPAFGRKSEARQVGRNSPAWRFCAGKGGDYEAVGCQEN